MLRPFFHRWERRLASVDTDRAAQPFEWGLDWIPDAYCRPGLTPAEAIASYAGDALADPGRFFDPGPAVEATCLDDPPVPGGPSRTVTFPSAIETPDEVNNRVYLGVYPARDRGRPVPVEQRRAVLVLPQWNADAGGHVGLCRLIAWFGCDAFRISLPYHDRRKPPSHRRADFIVSANVGRTLQVCRQAVVDARRAVGWLAAHGYRRIGILGTSLGSCLSLLTTAHEPLIRAEALNHVSQYFADPVWEGLSTSHVRAGFDGHVGLDLLRRLWMPISPEAYLDRIRARRTLVVYALYDLTFPLPLSLNLVDSMRARGVPFETAVLPCGHYTTGVAPFKYLDAYYLIRFLLRNL